MFLLSFTQEKYLYLPVISGEGGGGRGGRSQNDQKITCDVIVGSNDWPIHMDSHMTWVSYRALICIDLL